MPLFRNSAIARKKSINRGFLQGFSRVKGVSKSRGSGRVGS